MATLIAFDTATERMTIALRRGERVVAHEGEGGARASATLLPAILGLLGEAGIAVADLDAIAFGRGPGAFTGLRTACSVAQGLAFGAGKPVLPIDSLLAVAEDARGDATTLRVWALIDARMDQIYAAEYEYDGERWTTRVAPFLTDCDALAARWNDEAPATIAGNAIGVFGTRLATGSSGQEAVKLWDLRGYQELLTLEGEGSMFWPIAFSPDGDALAAMNDQGALHFWRAPSWKGIATDEQRPKPGFRQ